MIPIITFINPDPSDSTRCGACTGLPTDSDVGCGWRNQYRFGVRGPACRAAEKLCADLREAGKLLRDAPAPCPGEAGLARLIAERTWDATVAAIAAAAKEER